MNVTLIAAQSLDGFIAPLNQEMEASTAWTSREDSQFFQEKSKEIGLVIMGRSTWETIPEKHRPLAGRINIVLTSQPSLIHNALPLSNIKHKTSNIETATYTSTLQPRDLVNLLAEKEYSDIAVIGGTHTYTQFLEAQVVDTIYLTIEPIIFGQGKPLFDKTLNTRVQLAQTIKLSDTVLTLRYQIQKS